VEETLSEEPAEIETSQEEPIFETEEEV